MSWLSSSETSRAISTSRNDVDGVVTALELRLDKLKDEGRLVSRNGASSRVAPFFCGMQIDFVSEGSSNRSGRSGTSSSMSLLIDVTEVLVVQAEK